MARKNPSTPLPDVRQSPQIQAAGRAIEKYIAGIIDSDTAADAIETALDELRSRPPFRAQSTEQQT